MRIKEIDVFRFVEELSYMDWSHQNPVFLDEVLVDNRDMIRKRGYALCERENVAFRDDFERKAHISVLTFFGVKGVLD
ncbi:hypothetical protein JG687_00016132 [Phytophthora cactorum]|uniref:Uncharacterized protein n=1 Tax=Phytophthora cactorum TaxID=29920 RepID=A0A8T1TW09_9STRA|nr:hypothetical protein JG687_00016132 [Phytophthora cactorum]